MNVQEANKIIAEYMGHRYSNGILTIKNENKEDTLDIVKYSCSLDALVPVWEKLKSNSVWINNLGNRHGSYLSFFCYDTTEKYSSIYPFEYAEHKGENIYEVCCIATAKAIRELAAVK